MKCYSCNETPWINDDSENDGIYNPNYQSSVYNNKRYIGKKVVVVKGRKFPIGSTYIIKDFYTYSIDSRRKVDYAIMTTGERIQTHNLKLVTPIAHPVRLKGCYDLKDPYCPNCGARLPEPTHSWYHTG